MPEANDTDSRPVARRESASFRIAYFDASLRDHTGHQANACRHIAKELRERGFQVDIFASIEIENELASELGATPCFRLRPYEQSKAFRLIDSFAQALSFGHDVRSAWRTGPYTFVYFNSVLAPQFAAIGKWLAAFPGGEAPLAAIEFGAPSGASTAGWFAQFPSQYREASRTFRLLAPGRLLLFTFDPAASAEYSGLLGLPVAALPAVHSAEGPLRLRSRSADGRITIGFLGQQREEKGANLLPAIVRGLRKAGCDDRILIHDGEPAERLFTRKAREIAGKDPLIEFLHQPANPSQWQDLLRRTDLLVLPYEPKRYGSSYSAVAIEAVSAGIPMVVPRGATMESLAIEYQGRATSFDSWDADAVCQAALRALASFDNLSALAFSGAGAWEKRNGARRFADRLLEFAANTAVPLPHFSHSVPPVSRLEKLVLDALLLGRVWARRILRFLFRIHRPSSWFRP